MDTQQIADIKKRLLSKGKINEKLATVIVDLFVKDKMPFNSAKTNSSYIKTLVIAYGKDEDDLSFLKKSEEVIDVVSKMNKSLPTKKSIYNILSRLAGLSGYETESEAYKNMMTQCNKIIFTKQGENKYSKKEENVDVSMSELKKSPVFYKKQKVTLKNVQRHILSILLTRRYWTPRLDLFTLLVVDSDKKMNKIDNFINYKTGKIVLNHYKTSNNYGPNVSTFNDEELLKLLDLLVNIIWPVLGIDETNNHLFVLPKSHKPFTQDTHSKEIQSMFEESIGKRVNINLLRKVKINHFIRSDKYDAINTPENKLRRLHAELFMHDKNTMFRDYKKVDDKQTEDKTEENKPQKKSSKKKKIIVKRKMKKD